MNYRQRFYDSYDRSNYNFKVTNSYYHFKNIQKIVYRKPEYNPYINLKGFDNYHVLTIFKTYYRFKYKIGHV